MQSVKYWETSDQFFHCNKTNMSTKTSSFMELLRNSALLYTPWWALHNISHRLRSLRSPTDVYCPRSSPADDISCCDSPPTLSTGILSVCYHHKARFGKAASCHSCKLSHALDKTHKHASARAEPETLNASQSAPLSTIQPGRKFKEISLN